MYRNAHFLFCLCWNNKDKKLKQSFSYFSEGCQLYCFYIALWIIASLLYKNLKIFILSLSISVEIESTDYRAKDLFSPTLQVTCLTV